MQESDPAIGRSRRRPAGPRFWPLLRATAVAAAIVAVYLFALWLKFNEADQRDLSLETSPPGTDYVQMNVDVARVDLLRSEMTIRISFRLAGKLALDSLRPAIPLQLVMDTIDGRRLFDFAKGQRINPIEAVFPLQGDANLYPFDHHKGVLWFFVKIPESLPISSGLPGGGAVNITPQTLAGAANLDEIAAAESRAQVDTRMIFTASIPGLSFRGSQHIQSGEGLKGLKGVELDLQRSRSVVGISIVTMLLMAALSIALLITTWRVVGRDQPVDSFLLMPMAVTLIFGLPALRSIQPNIPPPGTFGDSLVFSWAEIIAAGSAVALMVKFAFHR